MVTARGGRKVNRGGGPLKKTLCIPRGHEIEAVIFDLDGVLADSEAIHFRTVNRVLHRHGAAIGDEEFKQFVGLSETASWQAWRRQYALAETVEQLMAANARAQLEEIAAGVPAIPEAVALARRLHAAGLRLAIASSSTRPFIDRLLAAIGLEHLFAVRVSGEDPEIRDAKPAPDVYLAAAARIGVRPAACVAIEDSAPGVTAAKRAGMTCVAVPNHWTAHQDFSQADIVLESLRYFPLHLP